MEKIHGKQLAQSQVHSECLTNDASSSCQWGRGLDLKTAELYLAGRIMSSSSLIPSTADLNLVQPPPQPGKKEKPSSFFRCGTEAREMNWLIQGSIAVKWWSQDSNPGLSPRCDHDTCASTKELQREWKVDLVIISHHSGDPAQLWVTARALPWTQANHFPTLSLKVPFWEQAVCRPFWQPLSYFWHSQ